MQEATRCVWDDFEPAAVQFCEREQCAFIEQPANTWSNLTYIVIGVIICRVAPREGRTSLAALGVISIVLGLGSIFFHGSSTHIGEVIDVGAMYLLSSYVLVLNWRRLRRRHDEPWRPGDIWAFVLLSGSAIVVVSAFKGQLDKPTADRILQGEGLSLQIRAEALSVQQLLSFCEAVRKVVQPV